MASVRMGLFIASFTTWVSSSGDGRWRSGTGWRAWSLIRSSSATMIQLAISDEPPYDRNGVVSPVSGISLVTPPMTTKTCSASATREADRQQLAERVAADQRGAQAALDDQAVDDDDRHQPGEAELLAERGADEVGPGVRRELRAALAPAAAEDAAPRQAVLALDDLVVLVVVRERVRASRRRGSARGRTPGSRRRRRRRRAPKPTISQLARSVAT